MMSRAQVRRRPWELQEAVAQSQYGVSNRAFWDQSVISPLRYPGAKRQLVPLIEELIRFNAHRPPRLLVEPFCGGATASLRAVGRGAVEHIIIADANPLVAAFWYTAAFDTGWLINSMWEEPVTLERWDWWKNTKPTSRRMRALKCLFLNRTSFSGIFDTHSGPIGGRAQKSKYKIDCRFGKEGLERRIQAIGDLANTGRILDVWECDWRISVERTVRRYAELGPDRILMYMDPPYVEKARDLYGWSFNGGEHAALAEFLASADEYQWLLSYDDHPMIHKLYCETKNVKRLLVPHRYTARATQRITKNELLFTSYSDLPESNLFTVLPDPDRPDDYPEPDGYIMLPEQGELALCPAT